MCPGLRRRWGAGSAGGRHQLGTVRWPLGRSATVLRPQTLTSMVRPPRDTPSSTAAPNRPRSSSLHLSAVTSGSHEPAPHFQSPSDSSLWVSVPLRGHPWAGSPGLSSGDGARTLAPVSPVKRGSRADRWLWRPSWAQGESRPRCSALRSSVATTNAEAPCSPETLRAQNRPERKAWARSPPGTQRGLRFAFQQKTKEKQK